MFDETELFVSFSFNGDERPFPLLPLWWAAETACFFILFPLSEILTVSVLRFFFSYKILGLKEN